MVGIEARRGQDLRIFRSGMRVPFCFLLLILSAVFPVSSVSADEHILKEIEDSLVKITLLMTVDAVSDQCGSFSNNEKDNFHSVLDHFVGEVMNKVASSESPEVKDFLVEFLEKKRREIDSQISNYIRNFGCEDDLVPRTLALFQKFERLGAQNR